MLTNVAWDMGNVILPFSRQREAKALAALADTMRTVDEIISFIDGSPTHLALERGECLASTTSARRASTNTAEVSRLPGAEFGRFRDN